MNGGVCGRQRHGFGLKVIGSIDQMNGKEKTSYLLHITYLLKDIATPFFVCRRNQKLKRIGFLILNIP